MRPSLSSLFFGLATLVAPVWAAEDFFIITQCPTITMSRIDPIVDPGRVSAHVHNVCGGSGFGTNLLSPDQQVGSSCSSALVGDDKSNYWSPELYWQFPNGTYQPMIGGMRIYYFLKGPDVKPFPKGMHMISGTSMKRDAADKKALGVRISCDHGLQTSELPAGPCGAIAMGIYFPSCGLADGSISSDDNFSHMAWPLSFVGSDPVDDPNGETCPESHPIKYPTIFFESNYYPTGGQEWGNGAKVVLSNGDEWGPSFHADFHNGWDPTVLSETIKQCGDNRGPTDHPEKCAPLAPSVNAEDARSCRFEGQIPNEDVGFYRPLDQLPGCNPSWPKGMDEKPGCASPPPVPEMVYPNVYFENLLQKTAIPAIFTETNSTDAQTLKYSFAPSLGDPGQSRWIPWGSTGSNKAKLKVSSVLDILNAGHITNVGGGDSNAAPNHDAGNIATPPSSAAAESSSASAPSTSTSLASTGEPEAGHDSATSASPIAIDAASPDVVSPGHSDGSASSLSSSSTEEAVSSTLSAESDVQTSELPGVEHALAGAEPSATPASASASASASAFDSFSTDEALISAPASSASSVSAVVSTADSVSAAIPTAGHLAPEGHKTCQRKKRGVIQRRSLAGHLGRRSRRHALTH